MDIIKLISTLFHAQLQAKMWHLETESFAEHKALQEFYEKIQELTDEYAEVCFGKHGRKSFSGVGMKFHGYNSEKVCPFFQKLAEMLSGEARTILGEKDTELANIMDEMLSLTNKTVYLLSLK